MVQQVFRNGDLVEVDASSFRAIARIRESGNGGRLHIAFEMGEYLPWIDGDVHIRHFGNDPSRSCVATIIHAGTSTALLEITKVVEQLPQPNAMRPVYDTLPLLED